MKKLWYISATIPILFYLMWILSRCLDSPILILFIFFIPLLLVFSIIWPIILLFKIKRERLRVLPLIILSLLPVLDSAFEIRFKIEDFIRPKKLFVAMDEGTSWGRILTARINHKFQYEESSWTGTKSYQGSFKVKNDTIFLLFYNQVPVIFNEQPICWVINKNENVLEIITDKKNKFKMKIVKNELN